MKSLILLTALFVSVPSLVHASCPSLAGKYTCASGDMLGYPTSLSIKETVQDGVVMYKINGRPVIADQLMRSTKVTLRDGEVITRSTTASCDDNKLNYVELNFEANETLPVATEEITYSIDAWGDLVVTQTSKYEGQAATTVTTDCEKQ